MNVCVASGKGGTGKTTIAVSLARVARGGAYVDCDVEEPNGHLFLKPNITKHEEVKRIVAKVDLEKCTFCVHRLEEAKRKAKAQGRALRDADVVLLPACNQACPASARYFGDLDDPDSTVSRLARSPRAFKLLEDLGTEPKVIYMKEDQG